MPSQKKSRVVRREWEEVMKRKIIMLACELSMILLMLCAWDVSSDRVGWPRFVLGSFALAFVVSSAMLRQER